MFFINLIRQQERLGHVLYQLFRFLARIRILCGQYDNREQELYYDVVFVQRSYLTSPLARNEE
jgi:hypothetical protein